MTVIQLDKFSDIKPYGFGIRQVQLVLLFLCMGTTYVTRVNLSMAIVGMTEEKKPNVTTAHDNVPTFDWDEEIKGTILSSFFWGYLVMNLPAAIMTHKFNNKLILGSVTACNGVVCFLTPIIVRNYGYMSMIIIRVLQGLLQGFMMPTVHNLMSRWVPPTERARSGSFVLGGMYVGNAVIMFSSGFMMSGRFGWPLIYYLSGCLTFIWVVLWVLLSANSPEVHPRISTEERNYIKSTLKHTANDSMKMKIPWKAILTSKQSWAIIFAHMGQNWGMWTLLTEIPTFFSSALNFDVKSNGELSALPYLLMWIVSFPLSYLADFLIKKQKMTIGVSRKFWNNIGQTLSGIFLIILPFIAEYVSREMTIVVYTIATVLNSCVLFGFNINHIDIAPNFSAILMGLSNGAANITSILGPLYVGYVVDNEDVIREWYPVFFMSAACYIIGSTIFTIFSSGTVQTWNDLSK